MLFPHSRLWGTGNLCHPLPPYSFACMFRDSGTSLQLLPSFAAYRSFVGMFRTILLPKHCLVSHGEAGQKVEVPSRNVMSSGSYISTY